MDEETLFSKPLIPCAPDGDYSGLARHEWVSLGSTGLKIGDRLIDPAYIEQLSSHGQVLKARYMAAGEKWAEECFFMPGIRSSATAKSLQDVVAKALALWAGRLGTATGSVKAEAPTLTIPEPSASSGSNRSTGRTRVDLHTAKVAFPPVCPVCGRGASHVSARNVSSGDNERGMWLVPVCGSHEVGDSIRVEYWRANATEVSFSFSSADYARAFAEANDPATLESQTAVRRQAATDREFVMYNYAVSAIAFSALLRSRVYAVRPGESKTRPGWRYSLLTALFGWWSLAGILHSLTALKRNSRGGIDVTRLARRALSGQAVTAYGAS